jgi:hypothetical protein
MGYPAVVVDHILGFMGYPTVVIDHILRWVRKCCPGYGSIKLCITTRVQVSGFPLPPYIPLA